VPGAVLKLHATNVDVGSVAWNVPMQDFAGCCSTTEQMSASCSVASCMMLATQHDLKVPEKIRVPPLVLAEESIFAHVQVAEWWFGKIPRRPAFFAKR
jgi:hypothetical protein